MQTERAIQDEVRDYILSTFYVTDPAGLSDEGSLIEDGIIDSTGMLDLIVFIEGRYSIRVLDVEASPTNLESVSRIARYVSRKLADTDAGAAAASE